MICLSSPSLLLTHHSHMQTKYFGFLFKGKRQTFQLETDWTDISKNTKNLHTILPINKDTIRLNNNISFHSSLKFYGFFLKTMEHIRILRKHLPKDTHKIYADAHPIACINVHFFIYLYKKLLFLALFTFKKVTPKGNSFSCD